MREDEPFSSEDMIRQARESLGDPEATAPVEDLDSDTGIELDPDEIDAIVAAELGPAPEPVAPPRPSVAPSEHDTATPRLGPPGQVTIPTSSAPTRTDYDGPVDQRRGLMLAIGAALIGSVAWAVLLAYLEIQSWLLGLGIGWLIGIAALRGAGRLTTNLKFAVAALAMASVLFGEVLGVALLFNKDYGFFDLPLAAEVYFENLDQFMSDFLFALGGGALGAWTAINTDKKPTPKRQPMDPLH